MLEGDAVVSAARAVYDPQTHHNARPFAENGSSARELALVLNELEVCSLGGSHNSTEAAARIMRDGGAVVVVVKRGAWGAEVHRANGAQSWVPAYESSRVFKIGTGDVFSALFAYHWAECGRPPEEAAECASRAVAVYCETHSLPISRGAGLGLHPVGGAPTGPILLVTASDTLGRRWLAEEARFRLMQLGADVIVHGNLTRIGAGTDLAPSAVLSVAEGLQQEWWRKVRKADVPIVVFVESSTGDPQIPSWISATVTDDFASAIYLALWSASSAKVANHC
jgi:hypothetical protein